MEPRRCTTFRASHTSFPLRHYVTLNIFTLPTARTFMILNSMNLPWSRLCYWDFRININVYFFICGPGSSVGDYGLDGPGWNPSGDEIFRLSRPTPGAHTASCKMGTGSFPAVKCGRGVLLTTHSLLVPRSWKSRAIPLPTLWATQGR